MELLVLKDLQRQDRHRVIWEVLHTAAQACEDELSANNTVKLSLTGWVHVSSDQNEHYTLRSYDASGSLVGSIHMGAESRECHWFSKTEKRRRNRKKSSTGIGFEPHRHVYIGEAFTQELEIHSDEIRSPKTV
ncbi:hypothetical protein K435DRAFT_867523 [Dendrothele bispora CBS 962.96]|uniref:Uncharacterized protein n=1 Tax=Dendrothele bispora (strain CBS 962.96) TaxID=1314807 RepID=A0A4S8LEJ2_DENBC|nr:hypothetical protein K435DRAFT_867523 [Dendrothele bispora CBS 962.96]